MFLVFAYETYYPSGGINDLVGTADSFDEAFTLLREVLDCTHDHAHIYDTATEKITSWTTSAVEGDELDPEMPSLQNPYWPDLPPEQWYREADSELV